jgi:TP901 family phage tail tape measure protein
VSDQQIRVVIDGDADDLRREVRKAKQQLDSMSQSVAQAGKAADKASRQQEGLGRELGGVQRRASRTTLALNAMQAAGSRQAQTLREMQHGAVRLGTAFTALAAVAMRQVLKAGMDFEQQMARVKAVSGATETQFRSLQRQAIDLGAKTKFSAGQAAAAMYELSSAGFSVKETQKALPGVLSLAAASSIELADAAEISSNALRGFGLNADQSGHVADVMAEAVNRSSLEMQDLQYSLKYVAPVAKAAGISLEEITAAISLMADSGIKGEQAGTTMRGGLVRLIKPTKEVGEGLKALGLNSSSLTGPNGLKPLGEIVGVLRERTQNLSTAQRNSALAQIFGTEALSGMLAVVSAGPTKLDRLKRAYEQSDGASKKAADTMNRTVSGAFENLKGSVETFEITLFQKFQTPLREALNEAADTVNKDGKIVLDWLQAVTDSSEFTNSDLPGQLGLIVREAAKEFDEAGLDDKLVDAFNAALPKVADAAGRGGIIAAKAFGHAFIDSSPLGRLVLAAWATQKTGVLAAWRTAGKSAGGEFAKGAAGGAAAGGAAGAGFKGTAAKMGKQFGLIAAAAAAVAYGPEYVKKVQESLASTSGEFDLPKQPKVGFAPLGFGSQLLGQLGVKLQGEGSRLQKFGEDAEKLRSKLDKLGDTRGLAELAQQARDLAREYPEASRELSRFATSVEDDVAGKAGFAFRKMKSVAGKSLSDIRATVGETENLIHNKLGYGTKASTDAMATNFKIAARAVQTSMDKGVISTKTGLAEIDKLMRRYLSMYGIKGAAADSYLSNQKAQSENRQTPSSAMHAGDPGKGAAVGGAFFLGRPGEAGRDNVPMDVNGQRVVAARGELVGIFNRHQQAELNQIVRQHGYSSLPGFFASNKRPHYMATGGLVAAGGALVSGDTDYSPQLGRRLNAMARAAKTAIHVTSGGRSLAEQSALVRSKGLYGPNNRTGAAAPSPNAPHVRGIAADISPGRERFGGIASRFGLGFTVPGEPWHIQLLDDAVAVGALSYAKAEQLKRVMFKGPGGAVGALGQAGLDQVRGAAQSRLDTLLASFGGSDGAGGGPPTGSAPGALDEWLTTALKITGHYSPANLRALRGRAMQESGGNPRAINNWDSNAKAGDPSKGLLQTIGSTFAQYQLPGHGDIWDPVDNAIAAIRYMMARYGHIVGPSSGGYAMGGLIPAANGLLATGGSGIAHLPGQRKVKLPRSIRKTAKKKLRFTQARVFGKLKHPYPSQIFTSIDALTGTATEILPRQLQQLIREQERTDEQSMIDALLDTNPDGTPKLSQQQVDQAFPGLVGKHLSELDAQFAMKDRIRAAYEDKGGLQELYTRALAELRAGWLERSQRVLEIQDSARRNARRIMYARKDLEAEQKKPGGWREKIGTNNQRISELQDDLNAETDKKHSDPKVQRHLREQISELKQENTRLRRDKPKGGDTARKRRLQNILFGNRDLQEFLVGSRSEHLSLGAATDESALGVARAARRKFAEGIDDYTPKMAGIGPDLVDIKADLQDILDQKAAWTGKTAPRIPTTSSTGEGDTGLADLLRQQRDDAIRRFMTSESQRLVIQGFAPLLNARLVGSFARGVAHVPETGLAMVHKDETILSDPQGAFGNTLQQAGAPVEVKLYLQGDSGALMNKVRAEVDGRAVRVVSEVLGRRSRTFAISPGGR